jgi:hypothetical protein
MIQLGPIINIPGWYEACIHYTPDIETGMKQYISGITSGPNFLQGWYWKRLVLLQVIPGYSDASIDAWVGMYMIQMVV